MPAKQIKLRYPGNCKTCGTDLPKGSEAWHFKEEKKVECLNCHTQAEVRTGSVPPPSAPPPARTIVSAGAATPPDSASPRATQHEQALPGQSAKREYERRTAKRQDELQDRWGSKLGKLVWLLEDEKQSTSSWAKGAKGEEKVGAFLEKKLDGTGCDVLHDRKIPGSRANIDHIVIGPAGVTVIDAKNIKGDCRKKKVGIGKRSRTLLTVNGRDRTKLITGVVRQVDVVSEILEEADFDFSVTVAGAICWWNYEGLPLIGTNKIEIDRVKVLNPNGAIAHARREGALGRDEIGRVADRLDKRLRPA